MKRKSLSFERLENRRQMASDWMNAVNPLDVNSSGEVTPLDVLLIINDVNQSGSRELPSISAGAKATTLLDVNGDGAVSPIDAWRVVSALATLLRRSDDRVLKRLARKLWFAVRW